MIRRVEFHQGSSCNELVIGHVLDANSTCRGEPVVVAAHLYDVRVLRDRPESGTIALFDPCHRALFSESGEGGVGKSAQIGVVGCDVGIGIAEIGMKYVESHDH